MNAVQVLRLCIVTSLAATMFVGVVFMMKTSDEDQIRSYAKQVVYDQKSKSSSHNFAGPSSHITSQPAAFTIKQEDVEKLKKSNRPPSVHIFYYPWYGNPEFDGKYYHWNHPLLKPSPRSKMAEGNHTPPNDVASMFYPELGPYSSRDPAVIEKHMKWISSAGIDVIAVSWYPSGKADEQGYPWDSLMPALLNASEKYKLKMAFHLEPYPEQTALSVRNDIEYIIKNYGHYPSFYKTHPKKQSSKELPLFYVYDSYKITGEDWAKIATPNGSLTIRNTDYDSLLIGLALKMNEISSMAKNGFDGIYTYFAADGFTEASSMNNWPKMSQICSEHSMLFIPSVGPGYDDTRVRPWNAQNIRSRANGSYYRQHFEVAHASKADVVSITSFNEFHESTQIEPVIKFRDDNGTLFVYEFYDKSPDQYLQLTHEMIHKYFTAHRENIPANLANIV